jgi:hypothetical protein
VAGLVALVVAAAPARAADSGVTGMVVTRTGEPLADVDVTLAGTTVTTGSDGRFAFESGSAGPVGFRRAGYATRAVDWDGAHEWMTVPLAPRLVRGIHVAGWVAADAGGFQDMLDVGATTSVNALMIDLKDENGWVYHRSPSATVAAIGSAAAIGYDLGALVDRAHSQDFYVITRIVTFQDPIAAKARPAWAARDGSTGLPLNLGGQYFLDPSDASARAYALELAVEACRAGVDEVQFDYVRYPDGDLSAVLFDGPADAEARQATIAGFLAQARAALEPLGCATAADIFGWITHTPGEGGIGQQLEAITEVVDVVSPMIYPSHYSAGWYGFSVPNDHPAEVVTAASEDALARMTESEAVLRPWLQDFWYTADQVRAQITAVDGLGLGWMLWNIRSVFTVAGIPTSPELVANESAGPVLQIDRPASGFYDVLDSNVFSADVAWLAAEGITVGCNPPWGDLFCPEDEVTRGQMAAFLVRALDLPAAGGDPFWDDDGSVFEADIERLAAAGITVGCNPPHNTRFCPDQPVTRQQMAAFLHRAV